MIYENKAKALVWRLVHKMDEDEVRAVAHEALLKYYLSCEDWELEGLEMELEE